MRYYFLLLCGLLLCGGVSAQTAQPADTSYWTRGGVGTLTFSSVSLTNWAAGGENSLSLNAFLSLYSNYAKGRTKWENSLDMGYGLIKQGESDFSKSDDIINLTSKYGYKLGGKDSKWYFSALADFRTQFAEGRDAEGNLISEFMAPGYLITALGLDYKLNENFSIAYAPVTGKFTFVMNDSLAQVGAYGVDPGDNSRAELGSFIRLKFKKNQLITNVSYETQLELFANYLENFGNVDVNWENVVIMKVNKWLTANLITQLLYDDDIDIQVDENDDGIVDAVGPRIQFKSVFGLGLTYSFGASKK